MLLKKIRNFFLTGILVLLPLIGSLYILWYVFVLIDSWTRPLVEFIIGKDLPGVGIILDILLIFVTGILATNIIGKKIIQLGELILLRIPLLRNIYFSIKQILEGVFTHKKSNLKKPILFEYPRTGLYQIGFITKETTARFNKLAGRKMYNIFLPTTPNPTSGMFIMVPQEDAIILDISVEDALKLVVSGGIIVPGSKKKN